jgi:hypothetical protein
MGMISRAFRRTLAGAVGDGRSYDHVCALRAVTSSDGMTADFYPFDMAFLGRTATRVINEVGGERGGVRRDLEATGDDRVGDERRLFPLPRAFRGLGSNPRASLS